ncbi:MAG: hypothetical protein WDO18_04730 [Acidobacteriota bacterium]
MCFPLPNESVHVGMGRVSSSTTSPNRSANNCFSIGAASCCFVPAGTFAMTSNLSISSQRGPPKIFS